MKQIKSVDLKEILLDMFSDVLERGDISEIAEFLDTYPEVIKLIEQDVPEDFMSTEESWERLKQRLIDDGVWRDE